MADQYEYRLNATYQTMRMAVPFNPEVVFIYNPSDADLFLNTTTYRIPTITLYDIMIPAHSYLIFVPYTPNTEYAGLLVKPGGGTIQWDCWVEFRRGEKEVDWSVKPNFPVLQSLSPLPDPHLVAFVNYDIFPVEMKCFNYDFTASNGGWSGVGSYSAGNGWRWVVDVGTGRLSLVIHKAPGSGDFVYGVNITYVVNTPIAPFNMHRKVNLQLGSINPDAVYEDDSSATGTVNFSAFFEGISTSTIELNFDNTTGSATTITLTSMTIYYLGSDVYGTPNCSGIDIGAEVDFFGTNQDDVPVALWFWDFGDGNTAFGQNPSHTYLADGFYVVSLTITGIYGGYDTTHVGIWINISSLFEIRFQTPATPPITSYSGEYGTVDLVDTASLVYVADGAMNTSAISTAGGDPAAYKSTGLARVTGRALRVIFQAKADGGTTNSPALGWLTDLLSSPIFSTSKLYGLRYTAGLVYQARNPSSQVTLPNNNVFVEGTYDTFDFVLMSTGCYVFINKILVWVFVSGTDTPLYPAYGALGAANRDWKIDFIAANDIPAPFDTDYGIAITHQASPVSGTDYSGAADGIFDLTGIVLTGAPSASLVAVDLRYNKLDANNYNFAQIKRNAGNTAWDMVRGVMVAGVPGSTATVTGVGTPDVLRVIHTGNLHDYYTAASNSWTKRGAQLNNANQAAQTTVSAVFAAGCSASFLTALKRSDAAYNALDV